MFVSYICLFETFYSWDHVVYLALCEDNTHLCLYASLLICANNADLQYVCMFIYIDVVHSSRQHTLHSLVIIYTMIEHAGHWVHPQYYYYTCDIHLILNCVHKYTDIYNAVDLITHKRVMVIEGGSIPYPSQTNIDIHMHTYKHICLPKTCTISVFLEFLDLQKYGNSRYTEIWIYWNYVCMYAMYIHMFVGRQIWLYVCIRHIWVCMGTCMPTSRQHAWGYACVCK